MNLKKQIVLGKGRTAALLCGAMCVLGVSAAHYYVVPGGTGDYSAANPGGSPVDAATKATASGDMIHLAAGTYACSATVTVQNGVTLIGGSDNPEATVLVRSGTGDFNRVVILRKNAALRNLTARGGYTVYQGAGVLCYDGNVHGDGVISNCVVENASAKYMGGGGCGGVWYDCVIRNCEVRNTVYGQNEGSGGGVFCATLYNCVVTNNTAGYGGGGVAGGTQNGAANGTRQVTKAYNCLIGWNRARFGGGAGASQVMSSRDLCQLYGCTVVSNTASTMGGGAFLCTISNSVVSTNYVPRANDEGTAAAGGGVMYCNVFDSTLEGNRCVRGGAGAANSNLTGCRIVNNFASYLGGGTYDCPLVKNCLLAGNTGNHGGAGFSGYFENCVMTNNTSNPYHGSATYNATTRNCIVVGNYATTYLAHCRGSHYGDLVYGNRNGYGTYPSGIGTDSDREGETVPVVNCTVWGNLNGSANVGRATLTNSIVWSVENMGNYSAVNSFWRNGTVANQTGCISGTDKNPKFVGIDGTQVPPAETARDAPWAAYTIRTSSPCRDTGLTLAGQVAEMDALGQPRVKNGCVDMGALECVQSLGTYFLVR